MLAATRNTRAQNEWTALTFSAWNGHTECARLLLDAGADMETQDSVRIHDVALSAECVGPKQLIDVLVAFF